LLLPVTLTTATSPLSLHDALPICLLCHLPLHDHEEQTCMRCIQRVAANLAEIENAYATLPTIVEKSGYHQAPLPGGNALVMLVEDRKSTRLNSSHDQISYAVFCLK